MDDADRIGASGVPVQLAGKPYTIKFDMRATLQLEKRFGTLTAFHHQLNNGAQLDAAIGALACALKPGIDEDELIDMLEIDKLDTYLTAIESAIEQAFPPPPSQTTGNGSKKSNGRSSTGSARSGSNGAKQRSGK